MAEKENASEQGSSTKKSPLFLIIAGALAVLLIGGGITAFLLLKGEEPSTAAGSPGTEASVSPRSSDLVGPMVDIEPFIVNILDPDGTRYLKAAITLEVQDETKSEAVKQRMPQVRDAILLLMGNKTFNELSDLQGKLQLRSELLDRLNEILGKDSVQKIYFTDFVVQ
ncbi:MAG: flagellar basal body-associated FliL family protein [Syntrophotaleaceae bacterium]